MYLRYYGLQEPPFSITPDPRFVHLSERHRDALAHLLFGIDKGGGGGFVQLTGEVGTGKTTLSRLLLEQLPENARIALVLNPRQNAVELLETICEELRIDIEGRRGSPKALVDALNTYLLDAYAQGLRVVLLIDEAQNLPADALEQVRLLTNLETDTQKLLQILLLGQPELRDMLARPELRQLAQRITARYHLTPLDVAEAGHYLRHRWRVAGGQKFPFTAKAVQRLHARSGGVPRLINVIATRALLAGYARDATAIDHTLVEIAAREVLPPPAMPGKSWHRFALVMLGLVAVILGLAWWRMREATAPPPPATAIPAKAATTTDPAPTPATASAPAVMVAGDALLLQTLAATSASPLPGWRQLLDAWGLPASSITVDPAGPCTPAGNPDLHCVQGRGRLDLLLALDRPALLRLRGAAPAQAGSTHESWALLLGADARRARLRLGAQTLDVDRMLLQSRWNGEFVSLWVGQATPPAKAEIVAFQNARGLPVDGVAGPLTLMALASDAPGPRLLRTLEP